VKKSDGFFILERRYMPKDKDSEPQNNKIKLFPVFLGIAALVFLFVLSRYRNNCALLSSLGSLTFTMFAFLVLITVFYEIKKIEIFHYKKINKWIKQKCFKKIIDFIKNIFNKRETNTPESNITEQETEKTGEPQGGRQDGLIEIKKENAPQPRQESLSPEKRVYSCVYVIVFLSLAFWRIRGMFKVLPLSYTGGYRPGIADAVLLLIFPCVAALYLKMRKDSDSRPTDKISRDILTFFSYISFIYAAVIAAASVLKINFTVVLPWVYYAASVYLAAALGFNILLTVLKGDILSFDYVLFPKFLLTKDKITGFTDSTALWKISLKSLYTIRYTLKILPALAFALIFVLFLSTGVFVVQPHQQAAVYHFGKLKPSSIKDPGLHFKFPWPIDKTEIYDVRRAASMQIGYESSGTANFLWTQRHDIGEYMLLLGNGNEMAAVNLKIIYVISDLYSYIKTCTNAEAVLGAAAYNALMKRTINTTLDSFLNTDRNSLSMSVLDELSRFCETEKLGFSVIQVIIESIHPPVDIADVYQKVVSASVNKTAAITKARTFAETKVIDAARLSRIAVDHARAVQHDRTSDAQKETAVFYAATDAHGISPGAYELAKNLDLYEKIINGHKVYVFSRGTESVISKFIIGKVNAVNLTGANKGEGNE
jgi:regulator of protease activity HflC (stomatin/prohibitin superfamily)